MTCRSEKPNGYWWRPPVGSLPAIRDFGPIPVRWVLSPYERSCLESGNYTVHDLGGGQIFVGAKRHAGRCPRCRRPFTADVPLHAFVERVVDRKGKVTVTTGWKCLPPPGREVDIEHEVGVAVMVCWDRFLLRSKSDPHRWAREVVDAYLARARRFFAFSDQECADIARLTADRLVERLIATYPKLQPDPDED